MRLAEDSGLNWRYQHHAPRTEDNERGLISPTTAVILGDAAVIERLINNSEAWSKPAPHPRVSVWTDDYSNVLGALMAHRENARDKNEEMQLSFDKR